MIQLYVVFPRLFFLIGYYRLLSIVLCVAQQALVYLFYTQQYVYVNPSPLSPWTSLFCLCICFSFVYMFICIRIHSICLSPVLKGEQELPGYMVLGDETGVQWVLGLVGGVTAPCWGQVERPEVRMADVSRETTEDTPYHEKDFGIQLGDHQLLMGFSNLENDILRVEG